MGSLWALVPPCTPSFLSASSIIHVTNIWAPTYATLSTRDWGAEGLSLTSGEGTVGFCVCPVPLENTWAVAFPWATETQRVPALPANIPTLFIWLISLPSTNWEIVNHNFFPVPLPIRWICIIYIKNKNKTKSPQTENPNFQTITSCVCCKVKKVGKHWLALEYFYTLVIVQDSPTWVTSGRAIPRLGS